ncbi:MAG TPA: hypothetical protein VLK26_12420 [Rudaea sp.]|nr:hypothetical protein [Rudaea sp.]
MISTDKTMRTVLAMLLAGASICANAQTTFSTDAPFIAVDSAAAERPASAQATDPEAFGYVPADPDLNFPYSPYAGAQLTLANAGPQAQITSVRLYAYALKTVVYQHVSARFRFWNAYQASADPVFSTPAEFVVDLTACPCNFVAGKAYWVDVILPKPVYTESLQVGFSQVWEGSGSDGVLAITSDLVPAFDTSGGSTTSGTVDGAYANPGRSPDDLNFVPTDVAASATKLGVALNGKPLTLDQCTGAANFQDQFSEEFDDASAFFQRWKANPNNGTLTVGTGYLALSAPDNAAQFPYIASGAQATMIPPTGNFEVRWRAVYTINDAGAGDGEMVLSQGTPLNGNNGGNGIAHSWQDSAGFHLFVSTGSGNSTIGGGQGTIVHDIEYCWVNGNVELWKDGARIFGPAAQPAQRPDSIWFGNPIVAVAGPWNNVTIYRVQVRGDQTTFSDHIFGDGFGSMGN